MLLCGCLGGAPECTSARRTAGQGVRLGPRESEIPASTARGLLRSRRPPAARCSRETRPAPRPTAGGLERLQVPAARRAPRAGVEGEEQLAVPEQRFRRDLDAALVPQSKVGAQLPALSARSACRVAIKYSAALRIASRRRACLASSPDPLQRVLAFPHVRSSVSPRWSVTPGNFGLDWSKSSSRRRQI